MELNTAVQEWFLKWRNDPIARSALKLLKDNLVNTKNDLDITLDRIVLACFNAKFYNRKLDPGEIYRQNLQKEKERRTQLANAAHILMLSAKRNDKSLMWACSIAELASEVCIKRKNHNEQISHDKVVEKYFLSLENALRGKLPELDGGPWLHRFTTGNLILRNPILQGRPIVAETMLAYELAFYLRMHTAGKARDILSSGQVMPKFGKPCFPIVSKFCSAVFGTTWDAKQIGDNVRALKDVGLTKWQGVNWKCNSKP